MSQNDALHGWNHEKIHSDETQNLEMVDAWGIYMLPQSTKISRISGISTPQVSIANQTGHSISPIKTGNQQDRH